MYIYVYMCDIVCDADRFKQQRAGTGRTVTARDIGITGRRTGLTYSGSGAKDNLGFADLDELFDSDEDASLSHMDVTANSVFSDDAQDTPAHKHNRSRAPPSSLGRPSSVFGSDASPIATMRASTSAPNSVDTSGNSSFDLSPPGSLDLSTLSTGGVDHSTLENAKKLDFDLVSPVVVKNSRKAATAKKSARRSTRKQSKAAVTPAAPMSPEPYSAPATPTPTYTSNDENTDPAEEMNVYNPMNGDMDMSMDMPEAYSEASEDEMPAQASEEEEEEVEKKEEEEDEEEEAKAAMMAPPAKKPKRAVATAKAKAKAKPKKKSGTQTKRRRGTMQIVDQAEETGLTAAQQASSPRQGVRRSNRQRSAPLQFYANERYIYSRSSDGIGSFLPTMSKITPAVRDATPRFNRSKPRTKPEGKKATNAKKRKRAQMEEEEEPVETIPRFKNVSRIPVLDAKSSKEVQRVVSRQRDDLGFDELQMPQGESDSVYVCVCVCGRCASVCDV